jgi:acyl dehydratase
MPPSAREKLGRPSPLRVGPYPVSEAQIGYFCEMVRDANPLYLDHRYAAASRHGGIVAPPQSLRVWCMPRSTQMGIDSARPDVDLPDQLPWPDAVADQDDNYFPPDTTEIIVQKVDVQFGVPMRVGDRLGYTVELGGCSALKQTKLGPGYFVTRIERVTNQNNELVGQRVQSILHYSKP